MEMKVEAVSTSELFAAYNEAWSKFFLDIKQPEFRFLYSVFALLGFTAWLYFGLFLYILLTGNRTKPGENEGATGSDVRERIIAALKEPLTDEEFEEDPMFETDQNGLYPNNNAELLDSFKVHDMDNSRRRNRKLESSII